MPELSELLKHAVGDVPRFDASALVARRRRQRRVQTAVGAGAAILVVGSTVALVSHTNGNSNERVSTRSGASDSPNRSTTTQYPYLYDTTAPRPAQTVTKAEAPQAGDFTGTLTAQPTTVRVGQTASFLTLTIRNASNHTVDPSSGNQPTSVATVCGRLAPGGQPDAPLQSDVNVWLVTAFAMNPGDEAARSNDYQPTAGDVGTITCEAAIVGTTNGSGPMTFLARLPTIPAVTITVLPAGATDTVGAQTTVQTSVPTS
jgi:hypothetical protein